MKRIVVGMILVGGMLVSLAYGQEKKLRFDSDTGTFRVPFGRDYDYNDIMVRRVVDGDTIVLESGERVRLIGIDTPELHDSAKLARDSQRSGEDVQAIRKMGERAADFTRSLLSGRRVRLEIDVEKHDKYGRILAYVYRVDDGLFVNAEILRQGYASLMTFPPNVKHVGEFTELYKQARENKLGLWAE